MSDAIDIVLVRHASTSWTGLRYSGRSDPPLSAAGKTEAAALGERLGPYLSPGTRIVSGASRRALATAEAIARLGGALRVERDPRWDEIDFGAVDGLRFDEVAAHWPQLAHAIVTGSTAIDWPGGETAAALAARVEAAWNDLIEAARPAVVVTHAGPILHALRLANADDAAQAGVSSVGPGDIPRPATEVRVRVRPGTAHRPTVLPSRA